MRKVPQDFQAHLDQQSITTCYCWIIERADGTRLGFTDHDELLVIDQVTCHAESGLQPTEAVSQLGFGADHTDVAGALDHSSISEADIEAGAYDNARIHVWLVNWADVEQRVQLRTLIMGEITREDTLFKAELRGLTSLLDRRMGRSYSRGCSVELGGNVCGVDTTDAKFSVVGSVTSSTQVGSFRSSAPTTFEAGWFAGGKVVWLSGANAQTTQTISLSPSSTSEEISLVQLPPQPIEVDDTFRLISGCDKRFSTCKTKFANALNFQGFPHIPGNDFATSYAANGNNHDGSPLVS